MQCIRKLKIPEYKDTRTCSTNVVLVSLLLTLNRYICPHGSYEAIFLTVFHTEACETRNKLFSKMLSQIWLQLSHFTKCASQTQLSEIVTETLVSEPTSIEC